MSILMMMFAVYMYSKLLHTLDQAVTADPLSVGEAVLDKSYMAQLVEVQHHRGATGGQMLVQVVQLEQPRLPGLWQEDSECSRKHIVMC
jgi:integrator complex subunit 1